MHDVLRRARVHVFEAVLQCFKFVFGHQLAFADENLIRKTDLTTGFLAVIQGLRRVFGIHQCQH